jgi:hypothetical protein
LRAAELTGGSARAASPSPSIAVCLYGEAPARCDVTGLGPEDRGAVEAACRLAEPWPDAATIAIATERHQAGLRWTLASDIRRACMVRADPEDPLDIARALAAAISASGSPDFVLCGRHAVDSRLAPVAPALARLLGIAVTEVQRPTAYTTLPSFKALRASASMPLEQVEFTPAPSPASARPVDRTVSGRAPLMISGNASRAAEVIHTLMGALP